MLSDKVREANGCVLVHCLAGVSRSPTLAIAYIMHSLGMSMDEAYRFALDRLVSGLCLQETESFHLIKYVSCLVPGLSLQKTDWFQIVK